MKKAATDHHYAGVLLISPDGHAILQRRERRAGIKNPGMLTTFGGRVEMGETPAAGAMRELNEELGIVLSEGQLSPLLATHESVDGCIVRYSIFIAFEIDPLQLTLSEGERIEILPVEEALRNQDLSRICKKTVESYVAKYWR